MNFRLALIVGSVALVAAAQGGVDGRWAATTPSGPSGVVLELKSEGGRLTGWLTQPRGKLEIANGAIEGDSVSFELTVNFQGRTVTVSCSGRLERDELRLVIHGPDGGGRNASR